MTETAPEYNAKHPWDRQDEEPTDWYDRFVIYRMLGPSRSIVEAYRQYMIQEGQVSLDESKDIVGSPSPWYRWAREYEWERRAALYDDYERAKLFANEEELKESVRRKIVESSLLALEVASKGLELKKNDSQEVKKEGTAALSLTQKNATKILTDILALVDRKQHTQLDIIIKELPESLQAMLIKALS